MTFQSAGPVLFDGGVSAVTATPGANDPEVGSTKRIGSEDYVYVYNAGGTVIPPGHAAVCSASVGGAYNVTVSSVSGTQLAIGVCKHASIPTLNYGWLVTRGFVAVEMGNFSAVAGSPLTLAGDGLFDIVSGFTGTLAPMGNAQSAIASAASGQAFIRC
jgi:hypothetical protein